VHSRYVRRAIVNVIPAEEPSVADLADDAPTHEPVQAKGEDRTNGDDNR
jgi:preprotein translocase subunit YajC